MRIELEPVFFDLANRDFSRAVNSTRLAGGAAFHERDSEIWRLCRFELKRVREPLHDDGGENMGLVRDSVEDENV